MKYAIQNISLEVVLVFSDFEFQLVNVFAVLFLLRRMLANLFALRLDPFFLFA